MSSAMTKSDAARVQSGQAKGGQDMSSGGFAARAPAAGDTWANSQASSRGNTGNTGSGGSQSSRGKK